MRWLFRPAATLLGRLRYAHKFVVVGLVLLLPLGFVAKVYVDLQHSQIASSAKERVGVAYMAPLVEPTAMAVAARHEVSTGAELGLVEVGAGIARVEEADRRHGADLGVGREWAAARDLRLAADVAVPAAAAFQAYNRAVDALLLLIVHVGDRSNLTLDPNLDTYYLMDALQFRLPILLDVTGRAVDRAVLARREQVGASTDVLIDLALANGVLASTRAALHTGISTSVASSRSGELRRLAPAGLQAVDKAVIALEKQLTEAVKRRTLAGLDDDVADPARKATVRFTRLTAAQLDRLLAVRIAGFSRRAHTVEAVAIVAVLLAIWLFVGFYLSVAGPVRRMVAMLEAVATGDLEQRVVLDNRDELRFIASTLNDTVAKTKAASERLAHQARHDRLTGLPNRALILDRLERSLQGRRPTDLLAVLFVDLDRFKPINDSLGHKAGDEVLRTVADRLRHAVRPADTVGRLAGDEFVVVCDQLPHERDAVDIATRLVAAARDPIVLRCPAVAGREVNLGASVGVAFAGPDASADELLGDADVAMYHAKQRGRGRVEIFDERLRFKLERRVMIQEQILRALHDDQFRVVYQPVADATSLVVTGFEALVRWEHPTSGTLSPAEFIPVAEETGLIVPLGAKVLREACRQAAAWRALPQGAGLEVSVNLSARQLADADLVATVTAALGDSGLPADALWLEITESTVMADAETAGRALADLRALGIRLAIDDFGTGYSSLAHLRRFPIEQLKIDRSFVAGLGGDPEDEAIVGLIISLATTLRLGVVAEGVETAEQLACLRRLGCDTVQGFHVGRPLPPELAFAALGTAASALVTGHR